ncbi:MAG: hypothetical protein L6R38_008140 [Xanthoria sp. 2 TBL-2021]|nr:MAG: hypothetical protein L6R38_008140 [Xanthoria sp. 2 TBL-2021]
MARKRELEHDSYTQMPQQKKRTMHAPASKSTAKPHGPQLPQLPPILDPSVAKNAFTHAGTLNAQTPLSASYERLEFLGDSYLGFLAAQTVHARYPNFDPGKLSQARQLLVCNSTFAGFSTQYKFNKQAQLPAEIRAQEGYHGKLWTKIMGDLFEAYVGAVITSDPDHGYATIDAWMTELWEPLLSSQVEADEINRNAKQELSIKIMTKGTKITYPDDGPVQKSSLKGRDVYSVKVCYTGLGYQDFWLGTGKGSSKAEAGYVAATKALQHPELPDIMAKKKEQDLTNAALKKKLEEEKESKGDLDVA